MTWEERGRWVYKGEEIGIYIREMEGDVCFGKGEEGVSALKREGGV